MRGHTKESGFALIMLIGIIAALAILAGMFGQPKGGWTHGSALVAVARVGGFLARRHDGSPGWQTIWRGWQRLMWMCDGVEALNLTKKRCG